MESPVQCATKGDSMGHWRKAKHTGECDEGHLQTAEMPWPAAGPTGKSEEVTAGQGCTMSCAFLYILGM